MKVKEVLSIIKFNVGTLDDISNKTNVGLFTNSQIVFQLKFALDKYANNTKAIESIHSIPLETETQFVPEPPLVLRSETYRFVLIWINRRVYPLDVANWNKSQANFPYQDIQGIPRWIVPWEQFIYIYPRMQSNFITTTLASGISSSDTTIPVASTLGFIDFYGRLSIGDEKIRYRNKDDTNFFDCERGIEDTTAQSHLTATEVKENNFWFFYFKKHFKIPVTRDNFIESITLEKEMDVKDEHIEVITDYTTYKLLSKLDSGRATLYKVNFDEWLQQAKWDIQKGRSKVKNTSNIRDLYWYEGGQTYPYV